MHYMPISAAGTIEGFSSCYIYILSFHFQVTLLPSPPHQSKSKCKHTCKHKFYSSMNWWCMTEVALLYYRGLVRKIWSDWRFGVGKGDTTHSGPNFRATDWSALICILSWTPLQQNNNNSPIDFQGCFKEPVKCTYFYDELVHNVLL